MTREEIIKLARQAGLENYGPTTSAPYSYGIFVDCVERFVALVAAAEREACAKECDKLSMRSPFVESYPIAAAVIRARGEKP